MRMRLPSRSAQIRPTARSAAVAFLTVGLLVGTLVWGIWLIGQLIGCRVNPFGVRVHHMIMLNRIVFACFAAAILFSITREWCAPAGCPRLMVHRTASLGG